MKRTLELLREFFRRADMLLFTLSVVCAVFGIIVITSASASYESPAKYVVVQAFAMILGFALRSPEFITALPLLVIVTGDSFSSSFSGWQ